MWLQFRKAVQGVKVMWQQGSGGNRLGPHLGRALSREETWLDGALDIDAGRSMGSGSAGSDPEILERVDIQ